LTNQINHINISNNKGGRNPQPDMETKDTELRQWVLSLINIITLLYEHQIQLYKQITTFSPPLSEEKKKKFETLKEELETLATLLRQQSKI
jgi:hypothetical protein